MEPTPTLSFVIDVAKLAEALEISEQNCISEFRDGRVISRFTELWAAEKFGFMRYPRNYPGPDGYCMLADGDKVEIAIRSLTNSGIRFQAAKYIGGNRTCSRDNLTESIRNTDRWLIFDIRNFPVIDIFKIRTSLLEHWIGRGELTARGLKAQKFAMLLNRDAMPQYRLLQPTHFSNGNTERRTIMPETPPAKPAPQPEPEPPLPPDNGD
jgi:hypothetical protein